MWSSSSRTSRSCFLGVKAIPLFTVIKILVIAAIAATAALLIYDAFEGPAPIVIGTGKTVARSRYSDAHVEAATRHLERRGRTYWEVRTPDGTWLNCEGDCAETYRRQVLDFWENLQEDKAGGR